MIMTRAAMATTGDGGGRWRQELVDRVAAGERFAGLYAGGDRHRLDLNALLVSHSGVDRLGVTITPDAVGDLVYPSVTPDVEAAGWYERAAHDLSGVVPVGHPRLVPLLLPRGSDVEPPRPGGEMVDGGMAVEERPGPTDVAGRGVFSVPYGPVRSGVFESIQFLVETPGEDIPHLNIRPHFKHRGVAKRFEGLSIDDAVLVAERVEGIASVAHALAFCHAVERMAGVAVPPAGALLRVVFAELERITNHLDVAMREAEAAGLSVAIARFGWHKETMMRLISAACGSRFGRGVVVPGGVRAGLDVSPAELAGRLRGIEAGIRGDARALMASSSFLDRLRRTGVLDADLAVRFGALGPVGRGSGYDDDARRNRPYDGYRLLPPPIGARIDTGDVLGRVQVRWVEIEQAFALIQAALDLLGHVPRQVRTPCTGQITGTATGWAEAAQGEVLYDVWMAQGRIRRCFARSASFHNLPLFHDVWHGDVKTDFAFIEASFGLSYAAVAM